MATKQFINCRQCISGTLMSTPLTVSPSGMIIHNSPLPPNTQLIDLNNAIIAPGFLELQINGALGFHFAHLKSPSDYKAGVQKLARYLPSTGVTGFYPTVPAVPSEVFKHVLPFLAPQDVEGGASVLGAHVEGPFLAPSKKGAHDAGNMHLPSTTSLENVYGKENLEQSIRVLTLAPELPGALDCIKIATQKYGIRVSMGHSAATYEEGLASLHAGASLLTHTFNAMNPLHHREPGLPGRVTYFHCPPPTSTSSLNSNAQDKAHSPTNNPPSPRSNIHAVTPLLHPNSRFNHLHPSIVTLTYRSLPTYCILITDSIELSGLPDGTYPGHAQIPYKQVKVGNKVTIEGSDTLVGTCIGLDECVRNLMGWAGINVEVAVRCVTENVAATMGVSDRGLLNVGRRADFVVLSDEGVVRETWVKGERVFERV